MSKGGGGGGTNAIDYQIQKDKLDYEKWQQAHSEAQARDKQQAFDTNRQNSFNTGLQNVRNNARSTIANRGLNYDDYASTVEAAIAGANQKIGADDPNPGQYFNDNIIDSALGKLRDDRRASYTNQVNNRFAPGFEQNYFADTSDDQYIDAVMGQQRNDAINYVNRARDRGQLDNTGFASAMNRIGEMERTGRSTAQSLGNAVLQGNRTRLADVANTARTQAGSYELGQSFDPNVYDTRFNTALEGMTSSLEGDVRGALEGQKFFDVGDLILRAGAAQGSTNPAAESADAIAAREKRRDAPRGTGAGGGTF